MTFDDGPNPFYTPQILAILQKYRVKATFFDVGYLVADYPNIVRQEYQEGNTVANHSWSHPVLTYLSAQAILWQLSTTTNAIQAAIGVRPTLSVSFSRMYAMEQFSYCMMGEEIARKQLRHYPLSSGH